MDAIMDGILKWKELAGPEHEAHREVARTLSEKYRVNFDPDARPREVLAVRAGGDPNYLESPTVTVVTAGGIKLVEPPNEDTLDTPRRLHGCFVRKWNPSA